MQGKNRININIHILPDIIIILSIIQMSVIKIEVDRIHLTIIINHNIINSTLLTNNMIMIIKTIVTAKCVSPSG